MKDKFIILEKNIWKGLIFIGCMMFFVTLEAQKIYYDYDESGNRIKRYIIVTKSMAIDTAFHKADNDSVLDDLKDSDNPDDEKKDAFEVLVYPNPTDGILEVELPELKPNQKADLYLYSRVGVLVKQVNRLQKRQSVDISNQPVGIYILRIIVDDKSVIRNIIKGGY
jgi:hypothetical protein